MSNLKRFCAILILSSKAFCTQYSITENAFIDHQTLLSTKVLTSSMCTIYCENNGYYISSTDAPDHPSSSEGQCECFNEQDSTEVKGKVNWRVFRKFVPPQVDDLETKFKLYSEWSPWTPCIGCDDTQIQKRSRSCLPSRNCNPLIEMEEKNCSKCQGSPITDPSGRFCLRAYRVPANDQQYWRIVVAEKRIESDCNNEKTLFYHDFETGYIYMPEIPPARLSIVEGRYLAVSYDQRISRIFFRTPWSTIFTSGGCLRPKYPWEEHYPIEWSKTGCKNEKNIINLIPNPPDTVNVDVYYIDDIQLNYEEFANYTTTISPARTAMLDSFYFNSAITGAFQLRMETFFLARSSGDHQFTAKCSVLCYVFFAKLPGNVGRLRNTLILKSEGSPVTSSVFTLQASKSYFIQAFLLTSEKGTLRLGVQYPSGETKSYLTPSDLIQP